jgi:hypothetical protein
MGAIDINTKIYFQNRDHFADLFNFKLYDGRQQIHAADLKPVDSAVVIAPYGNHARQPIQRIRDNVSMWASMQDDHSAYIILGIESQANIHYAMPVRNMVYDSSNYAEQIQTRAVDPSNFVDFQVQSVSLANAERGIVTVKVSHDLKDDFYYKQIGAKCALSIATGKTDITSKFVELVPKDNSGVVYVEGMKINTDDFEIEEGQTRSLTVTVNPESATDKTVTWTSSDPSIVSIDQTSGVLKAERQGDVTITATTNGVDEWGDVVTASVKVKVNPAFRLNGPLYVEVGKSVELSLDFPSDMSVESKVWMSSDETKATV